MFIKLFISLWLIFTYIHIMIHFSVTKENTIYRLYDVTKESIRTQITYKIPFYFDGTTIPLTNVYEPIDLLEPSVKFFPKHKVYIFHKYMKLHQNLECRNFYKVSSGSCRAICIHPKYKSLFQLKDHVFEYNKKIHHYIKENGLFVHVQLNKDTVLCLPNLWLLVLCTKEPCKVQKIQYSTIMNQAVIRLKRL